MKILALHSGGMDSTVLIEKLRNEGHQVRTIAFDYGQRHRKELQFVDAYARDVLREEPFRVSMPFLAGLLPGSSQTDRNVEVPKGRYDEDSMKATVVPNRNMIMLSIAIGTALAHKMNGVAFAAHGGDHTIYPDCRPEFVNAMDAVAQLCDWDKVEVIAPFLDKSKADICSLGNDLGLDFSKTWSCYEGREFHCGQCGTCIERREAFHLAGVTDPTTYTPGAPTVEQLLANDWKLPA